MPGRHNVLNATAAIAVAPRARRVGRRRSARRSAGFGGVKRRFTHTGEANGVDDHRRLRPPPGRDRRGAEGGARGDHGQGDRGRAAAPLHPPADPVRRVRHLLQRRRQRDRRRRLCGRRGADRGRRQRRAGRGASRAHGHRHVAAAARARPRSPADGRASRRARRLRRLPRRRHHHAMGLRAAGRARRARRGRERHGAATSPARSPALPPVCAAGSPPTRRSPTLTWFRVGGPARGRCSRRPTRTISPYFLRRLPPRSR